MPRAVSKREFVTSTPDRRSICTTEIETELSFIDAIEVCGMHLKFKPSATALVGAEDFGGRGGHVALLGDLTFSRSSRPWKGLTALYLLETSRHRVRVELSRSPGDTRTHVVITDESDPMPTPLAGPYPSFGPAR